MKNEIFALSELSSLIFTNLIDVLENIDNYSKDEADFTLLVDKFLCGELTWNSSILLENNTKVDKISVFREENLQLLKSIGFSVKSFIDSKDYSSLKEVFDYFSNTVNIRFTMLDNDVNKGFCLSCHYPLQECLHCIHGPALVYFSPSLGLRSKSYFQMGVLSRLSGPCVEEYDDNSNIIKTEYRIGSKVVSKTVFDTHVSNVLSIYNGFSKEKIKTRVPISEKRKSLANKSNSISSINDTEDINVTSTIVLSKTIGNKQDINDWVVIGENVLGVPSNFVVSVTEKSQFEKCESLIKTLYRFKEEDW